MSNNEHIERILSLLKEHPEGLTIHDISLELKRHTITVRIALAYLEGAEKVNMRQIGKARLYTLK